MPLRIYIITLQDEVRYGNKMKKLLRKIFYMDAPEYGALFGAVLFLLGSWSLLTLAVSFNGFEHCWKIFAAAEILLFFYLLICGIRFGKSYSDELTFPKRKKWQLPATFCWILSAFPVLQMLHTSLTGKSQFGPGILMNCLSVAGFAAMFFGIFCTAKIIENAAQVPWKKLFGKGTLSVFCLFLITVSACLVYEWVKML